MINNKNSSILSGRGGWIVVVTVASLLTLLVSINIANTPAYAATAGCYKITEGALTRLSSCPSSPPAVYDNAQGSNISSPNTSKCYIYSQNLYEGDLSYGDPYAEVPCSTLSSCPTGQELRYNEDAAGAPKCVDVNQQTDNTFAGGATPSTSSPSTPFANDCEPKDSKPLDRHNCGIINLIVIAINFLSAVAGIVFVASIMIAGFQYMTARDNAGQIQKAKSRIVMTLVSVAIFIFMYALLNFLVPGGVLPR